MIMLDYDDYDDIKNASVIIMIGINKIMRQAQRRGDNHFAQTLRIP